MSTSPIIWWQSDIVGCPCCGHDIQAHELVTLAMTSFDDRQEWIESMCPECDAAVQAFIAERRIAFRELRKRAGDAAGDKELAKED